MANDKRFLVKNGLLTQNVQFTDSAEGNHQITLTMLGTDTLSFTGDAGQLFSITDDLSGTIFAVNDISGVPSIEVDADGTIRFAETFGNILVGTDSDNGLDKLQVSGTVTAIDFNSTSDERFKSNIQRIENALEKLSQLNGYTFIMNETNQPSTGVIAQEVEKVLPEVVGGTEKKKTVSYGNLVGLLIEAIKELKQEIEDLKQKSI